MTKSKFMVGVCHSCGDVVRLLEGYRYGDKWCRECRSDNVTYPIPEGSLSTFNESVEQTQATLDQNHALLGKIDFEGFD